LPDWAPPDFSAYALTETRLLPAKVRVFIDFLIRNLKSRGEAGQGVGSGCRSLPAGLSIDAQH